MSWKVLETVLSHLNNCNRSQNEVQIWHGNEKTFENAVFYMARRTC